MTMCTIRNKCLVDYSFASRPLPHFISQLKLWLQVNLGVAWEQGEVRGQYRGNMSEWRKRATCDMLSKHKHAGKNLHTTHQLL